MLLAIDVGNTQVALGMFNDAELVGHWRISTNPEATIDEVRWQMTGILGADGFSQDDVHGVAISSVVPAITASLRKVAPHIGSGDVVVVEPGTRTGMSIDIDNPREVGADRIVNSVAARERHGLPVSVHQPTSMWSDPTVRIWAGRSLRASKSPLRRSFQEPLPCAWSSSRNHDQLSAGERSRRSSPVRCTGMLDSSTASWSASQPNSAAT